MSRIRANQITNQSADGAPTVQNGLVISGVTTSTSFSGSGASLTNLNASNIASGTVPTARLGSGTANSSTFLRGDSTFATVTSTTINNNANNRVITGSGSANTLEGESGLTYDGQKFQVDTVTSESNAFRIYNTTTSATTYQINGEGNSFVGHTYPRSDANLDLGYHSGYRWRDVVLSGGIRFGSANSSDYLDDYEEGTWSPVWSNAASGGTTSGSNNLYGKYTKIGRMVHLYFYTWGLQTGPTGSMYLQGFPFTVASNPGLFYAPVMTAFYNFGADNYYNLGIRIYTNQTAAELIFCRKDSGNYIAADFSGLINNYTNFAGTLTYEAA
tara:strand:+ start:1411 stop:2397 length:987 start_codon:yes stop_codon:yes gene_type:complete